MKRNGTSWKRFAGMVLLMGASAALLGADPTGVRMEEGRAFLGLPQQEAHLVYRFDGVPFKPYVERLLTPAGVNILRDAPSDHLHHHGLMFAVGVDNVNFWEEKTAPGTQRHRGEVALNTVARVRHTLTGALEWIDPKVDKPLLLEDRTIELYQDGDLEYTLATWESKFSLPEGKSDATLSGSEYFGLGMRFVESMDKGGGFFNADGAEGVEGTNKSKSKWCAYTALADGKPVTVAIFDHPANLRHPATWFTLETGFAYLAATLNLKEQPQVITAPVALRYGVALWDGETKPRAIEKAYQHWLKIVDDPSWRTVR